MPPSDDAVITVTVTHRGHTASHTVTTPAAPISSQRPSWLYSQIKGAVSEAIDPVFEELAAAYRTNEQEQD